VLVLCLGCDDLGPSLVRTHFESGVLLRRGRAGWQVGRHGLIIEFNDPDVRPICCPGGVAPHACLYVARPALVTEPPDHTHVRACKQAKIIRNATYLPEIAEREGARKRLKKDAPAAADVVCADRRTVTSHVELREPHRHCLAHGGRHQSRHVSIRTSRNSALKTLPAHCFATPP
jgi:hypothetical protein